ncbi:hypothetical protein [Fontivita pretiosa]|uniref:hypothetical protein n=1 Tax=Fontivita pretiosa TaxID=2989684 RepID=UPI003D16D7D5
MNRVRNLLVVLGMLLWVSSAPAAEPRQDPRIGIVVMAHGGNADWNRDVEATVQPLRDKYPLEIAYGMARTSAIRAAVERLEKQGVQRIAVVRMFISADSFLPETEYILGMRDHLPQSDSHSHAQSHASHQSHASYHDAGHASHQDSEHGSGGHDMEPPQPIRPRVHVAISRRGVSESPLIEQILVERVAALSRDPARESVLILAHGPESDAENQRWLEMMRLRIAGISAIGSFREVRCETLREDWPEKRTEAEKRIREFVERQSRDGGRVIVIPFRVAGFGPYKKVLQGLSYVADGRGFCPHANMTEWIEQSAIECFKE